MAETTAKLIALRYESEQGDASALRIMHAFDPEWNPELQSISIEGFTEGMMNTVRAYPVRDLLFS